MSACPAGFPGTQPQWLTGGLLLQLAGTTEPEIFALEDCDTNESSETWGVFPLVMRNVPYKKTTTTRKARTVFDTTVFFIMF